MRPLPGFLALLLIAGLSGPFAPKTTAFAQSDERARQVEELSAQGANRFRSGDYRGAIVLFEEAFNIQEVPNLLYNIGRCYEELGEYHEAVEYFQRYADLPGLEPDARTTAQDRIASIQRNHLDNDPEQDETPQDETEPNEEVVKNDFVAPPTPNRVPTYTALGGGAVLVGAGIFMGLTASSTAATLSDASLSYDDRLAARGRARTQGIIADVFYLTGAAALGTGIFLFLNASSDADQTVSISSGRFSPLVTSGHAGFTYRLDF